MRTLLGMLVVVLGMLGLAAPASATVCDPGTICLWPLPGFQGPMEVVGIEDVVLGDCLPLEGEYRSFVNRLKQDVTVYESVECATEADFTTYPGLGTYVPSTPFVVRGIQAWA
ncbi:peptidase inhibitor family I36 protein [Actinokineospora auranticolor]|uniref:Peptidase inhibitor family I36 n=1 Tax=Actinokineospora auranticolor TaxID=155976 RepID=A0A2S6GY16_9PSEU|nr:peptidase inhibitor family I36 protein [Actinokineospora auranticolor]PPK70113.1 peptidase inhibitor family I36 [Actinokineospora auranticolor]